MRFSKEIPPTDEKLSEKLICDGWEKIKEPKNLIVATLLSMPFAFINVLITIFIITPFYSPWISIAAKHSFSININIFYMLLFISSILILIVIHELCHLIFIPNFIKSQKTFWGITLNGGFVATTEKISKNRFIIISVAPFVSLSIITPIILGTFNILNGFIALIILINSMASSIDILNLFIILFQVPKNSCIINNGFETYFKAEVN